LWDLEGSSLSPSSSKYTCIYIHIYMRIYMYIYTICALIAFIDIYKPHSYGSDQYFDNKITDLHVITLVVMVGF